MEKDILRNFTKFTGKQMGQSLFFNKVTGLRPATLLKKETLAQNTSGRLLLYWSIKCFVCCG